MLYLRTCTVIKDHPSDIMILTTMLERDAPLSFFCFVRMRPDRDVVFFVLPPTAYSVATTL